MRYRTLLEQQVDEVVETMASLARTFTADEIDALVDELGEEKILELSVLIEELGKSRLLDILQEETS
jgi:dihydroxyacetone kinase